MDSVDVVLGTFAALTNDERMELLARVRALYCKDCGGPKEACECCEGH